jgi:hypothetical protein
MYSDGHTPTAQSALKTVQWQVACSGAHTVIQTQVIARAMGLTALYVIWSTTCAPYKSDRPCCQSRPHYLLCSSLHWTNSIILVPGSSVLLQPQHPGVCIESSCPQTWQQYQPCMQRTATTPASTTKQYRLSDLHCSVLCIGIQQLATCPWQ